MSARIYVGNLAYSATEAEVSKLFGQHGVVKSVSIVTDRVTQRPRGFAFVEMASSGDAAAAIEALNGTEFSGRNLTVSEARPRNSGSREGPRNEERSFRSPRRERREEPNRSRRNNGKRFRSESYEDDVSDW